MDFLQGLVYRVMLHHLHLEHTSRGTDPLRQRKKLHIPGPEINISANG